MAAAAARKLSLASSDCPSPTPLVLLLLLGVAAKFVSWKISLLLLPAALLLLLLLRDSGGRKRSSNEPPLAPGLPLIGCGLQFRQNAVPFLLRCRQELGELFTLRFPLGQHIHFVMNPHSVQDFVRTRTFDFNPIQRTVNANVFRFAVPQQAEMLKDMSRHARLAVATDPFAFCHHANASFRMLGAQQWRTQRLSDLVSDTMFRSVFNTVYGDRDEYQFNYRTVKRLLAPIHSSFLFLWLGLPAWLFPSTQRAWETIYATFPDVGSLLAQGHCNPYIRDCADKWRRGGWDPRTIVGHNMVYLHVYHNNCKIAYWLVNNLLHHGDQAERLRQEVLDALDDDGHEMSVRLDRLERLPLMDSFINETFRLASGVFLIREVTADTQFPTQDGRRLLLRRGDLVTMYPPALHRDPQVYEKPDEFVLDRFAGAQPPSYDGRPVSRPLLPYGVLCPGRRLSMAQLKLFTACLLANFELQPAGRPAQYDFSSYGDEILPPAAADAAAELSLRLRHRLYRPILLT